MEEPVWGKFRQVLLELYGVMSGPDYDLCIVKTPIGHDMIHVSQRDVVLEEIMSFDEVVANQDTINFLVSWAAEQLLPEDERMDQKGEGYEEPNL